ncbi:hypothetical protein ACTTAI_00045 (plasmid) [Rhodobacter capsulatus]|uniref:hypothetical protein n=1 Tax=Rhodobacter capsulatus TaxID=1061 RepID=UPI00402697E6
MRPTATGITPIRRPGFAADVDRVWTDELALRNLQESVLVLTVVRRQTSVLPVPLFRRAASKVWGDDTARRLEELREVAAILESGLGVRTKRLRISDGNLLGFYASLLTGEMKPLRRAPFCLLAEDAAAASLHFGKGQFTVEEGGLRPRVGALLFVKSYPTSTWPDARCARRQSM